nr:integrase, catalytic region, zinc finger, CCHC-type, peptidase aspartic, catalytic [Tanacetum cinerariifolium]
MDSIIPLGQKNTLVEYMILSGANNRPPMLDKHLELGDQNKKYVELSAAKKIQADCDMKATNIIPQGDDPITSLNKAIAFLTIVAFSRFPSTNNQLRTSSNLRNQATIQDGETIQVDRQGLSNVTTVKTEDLDTYDSDCDDISNAKAVLMANISNYGSDVILEVSHSETYLNDMENQSVLAMQDFEQPPAVDITNNMIHSDSNIIPLTKDFGKRFTTQQELSTKHAFWLRMSDPTSKPFDALPVKIEAPKELPKISLVNESLKKLKFYVAKFDNVVKIRTTPNAPTKGTTSRNIKNKVEAQPRNVNKKNRIVEPICNVDVKQSQLNANSKPICATCKKSMFDGVHDMCILDFVKNVKSRAKSAKKHKNKIFENLRVMYSLKITSANVVPPKKPTSHSVETQKLELKVYIRKPKNVKNVGSSKKAKIVESKNANHLEPNHTWGSNATDIPSSLSLAMRGCPDCSLVSRFWMFETHDREPLSAHEICVDQIFGSRDTNLYTISLDDMLKTSPFCLLSKASKTKRWLWYRQLPHLNFDTLNKLAKDGLARGIPRLKFQKDHMCSACALGKSKKSSY